MSPSQLKALLDAKADIDLIDIRESYEREQANIGGRHIPMAVLFETIGVIPKNKEVVIYCRSGRRSAAVLHKLHCEGYDNVKNLEGGLISWCSEIDPQLQLSP